MIPSPPITRTAHDIGRGIAKQLDLEYCGIGCSAEKSPDRKAYYMFRDTQCTGKLVRGTSVETARENLAEVRKEKEEGK